MRRLTFELRVPKKVRWFVQGDLAWQDRLPDRLWDYLPIRRLQQTLCLIEGHTPIPDQCSQPEHDYCAWCQKSLPDQADHHRESDDLRPYDHEIDDPHPTIGARVIDQRSTEFTDPMPAHYGEEE